MEKFLDDIKLALQVDNHYKKWIDLHHKEESDIPNKWIRMKESVFCYEFYSNYRNNWNKTSPNHDRYKDLYFHAEITKYLSKTDYSFPDFVLHGDQDNKDKQLIAIEVKVADRILKEKQSLVDDIKVLIDYVSPQKDLKYNMGLFIVVNMETCALKKLVSSLKKIKNILTKEDATILEKIYLLGTDYSNGKIKHFKLSDLKE